MSAYDFVAGELLLIDKPLEWTSFDVVNKVRNAVLRTLEQKKIKVGHAGTLDPLATGLLLIGTGRMTKKINELLVLDKEYTGTILLGGTTPSFDLETEVDATFPTDQLTEEGILAAAKRLTGSIVQTPPAFSAKKIKGERAYKKARRGETVELKGNNVTIDTFEITAIRGPEVDFRIVCSKGTYIRSIAHDLGKELQNGGHLTKLCRTRIGTYHLADALPLNDFVSALDNG